MDKLIRIKQLIDIINVHNYNYYTLDNPTISDREYDALYDELVALEKETGIILSNSPTQKVGYEIKKELNKVTHEIPLKSLNKTKSIDELKEWMGDRTCIVSLKCDGLTTELVYEDGVLNLASTRGDSIVGEEITHNVKTYKNIPLSIQHKQQLKIAGESIILKRDFQEINSKLSDDEKFKNPRNLAAGSVRQLNSKICANRNVKFETFGLLKVEGIEFKGKHQQLEWLQKQGFELAPYVVTVRENIESAINYLREIAEINGIPYDGMVITFNNIEYAESLGSTSKFPRHSIAYKFEDEEAQTVLRNVVWQTSRTGLINPVAEFDSVELEGTTVNRASLHNLSIIEDLKLGLGDTIIVRKANQIIPQVLGNLTRSNTLQIPEECPVCMGKTEIQQVKDSKVLICTNDDCQAKLIKKLVHFVSRDAMNIDGLSEATIEKFVNSGFIKDFVDIFTLGRYEKDIKRMDGFGVRSYNNLIKAIEKAKTVNMANFLYALGVSNVGLQNAKALCKHFNYNLDFIVYDTDESDFKNIEGFGDVIAKSLNDYLNNQEKLAVVRTLINYLNITKPQENQLNNKSLEGLTFVVTGDVHIFKNRKELQTKIESLLGKVSGSVSAKTNYLINNDVNSSSSKNKKAKELSIPIITEEQLLDMIK